MDSTYRVPLLDYKLLRLYYMWYYRILSPSGPSSALGALGIPHPPSIWILNAVQPRTAYPHLYFESPKMNELRMEKNRQTNKQNKRIHFLHGMLLLLLLLVQYFLLSHKKIVQRDLKIRKQIVYR